MNTVYFAELSKITSKDIEMLSNATEDDKIVVFCGKSMSMPIEMHLALAKINTEAAFFAAESEAEKCYYAGQVNAGQEWNNVLLTGVTFPIAVKRLMNLATKKPAKRTRTTKKKQEENIADQPNAVEHEKAEVEKTKADFMPAPMPTQKTEADPAPKHTKETPVPETSVPKKELPKETNTEHEEPEHKVKSWGKKQPKETIWLQADSEKFFSSMCALPDSHENREEVLKEIAHILYEEEDANKALVRIESVYGKEIARYIAKNVNLLLSAIKDGYNKKVDQVMAI